MPVSLLVLSELLAKHYGKEVIILIEEYDVPLDKAFQYGYYDEMVMLIRGLFGNALKTNSNLFFAMLTGCLRVSKESIFTGFNNFNIYSITTTMAYRSVGELVQKVMCEDYGNPSSMHNKGVEAEKYIKEAKETFARLWKVQEKEVYFTSGGTESDNMALIGAARANKRAGNHLITSSIEHPAIINTMRFLEEEEGFRVTYLPVDQYGRIRLDALQEALCEDTILVSIMYVNNEVGSVQPIQEAASIVKAYNKDILFHVDAVQGFGKYKIYPKKLKVDMCSVSGHKIHGPKGVGALYIGENVKIRPIVYGGGQQHDMRSGTENVPGIAGLSLAAKTIYDNLDKKVEKMRMLKQHFIEGVEKIENTTIHGLYDETSAPHIISVGIAGIRSEVLLHALEDKEIFKSIDERV